MQATITYLLSEQAQRAEMVATGQPVPRTITTTEEIDTNHLSNPLVKIDPYGKVTVDLTRNIGILESGKIDYGSVYGYSVVQSDMEKVTTGVQALEILTEKLQAASRSVIEHRQRSQEENKLAKEKEEKETAARRAEWQAKEDERAAAEQAKEVAKQQAIDAWVEKQDSDQLKQQHAEGLLDRAFVLQQLAKEAFAGLPVAPDREYCAARDCECGEKEISTLPPEAYSAWRGVREKIASPIVAVKFFVVQECADVEGEFPAPIHQVLVKVQHGPFLFSQEIDL